MKLPFRTMKLCLLIIFALEGFLMSTAALGETSHRDAEALSQASLIYIATVRKNGDQSRAAPVWFTTTPDGWILIQTDGTSWKARRIRRGSPVIVWIGKRDGPAFIGTANITSDPAVIARIVSDYPRKYLLARFGIFRPTQEKFSEGRIVAIKIRSCPRPARGIHFVAGDSGPQDKCRLNNGKSALRKKPIIERGTWGLNELPQGGRKPRT